MTPSTSQVLLAVEALLNTEVTPDVCDRFDGEPADAVDEHVVELRGASGTSVLVGFLSDDDLDEDEDTLALGATLRAGVICVVRRAHRTGPDDAKSQATDARQLDALYDACLGALIEGRSALASLGCGPLRIQRGQALTGADDWYGRVISVLFDRPLAI